VERGKFVFLALPLRVKKGQGKPHLKKPDQSSLKGLVKELLALPLCLQAQLLVVDWVLWQRHLQVLRHRSCLPLVQWLELA
jgi:hypothetical protein